MTASRGPTRIGEALTAVPHGPQLRFLDWLGQIACRYGNETGRALARAHRMQALAMLATQNDGRGLTGRAHWFETDALAERLGWSPRKVERTIADPVEDGWLHRTAAPVRGRGRRPKASRFDLVAPVSGDKITPERDASNEGVLASSATANVTPETELLATETHVSTVTETRERDAVNHQSLSYVASRDSREEPARDPKAHADAIRQAQGWPGSGS